MLVLWIVAGAHAAGYRLFEAGALYGTGSPSIVEPSVYTGLGEGDQLEAGFETSVFSDALVYWMTFGDRSVDGHRVKEVWLESHHYGPQLGRPPILGGDDDSRNLPPWLQGIGWFRLGADHTVRKSFEIDASRHFMLTIPGFWGVRSERFHFGPTAGLGWNLTWWENWKDRTDKLVSTGKITAEVGWVLGAFGWDTVFFQGRATYHYDLFGDHQTQLKAAAITGVFLDRLDVPLGLQFEGELDHGNDTVTTEVLEWWSARVALVYHVIPRAKDPSVEEMLETLKSLEDLPIEPPPPLETTPDDPEGGTVPEVEPSDEPEEAPPGDPSDDSSDGPSGEGASDPG
jgi:hypothetical protein